MIILKPKYTSWEEASTRMKISDVTGILYCISNLSTVLYKKILSTSKLSTLTYRDQIKLLTNLTRLVNLLLL